MGTDERWKRDLKYALAGANDSPPRHGIAASATPVFLHTARMDLRFFVYHLLSQSFESLQRE